ncbi:MAG: alpha/beta fold hydrolase, partial [Candidatus Aminicenantia bacterium]
MLRNIVISVIGGILTLTFGIILALLLSPAIKVIPNLAPLSAQIAGLALIITAILAGWLAAMLSGVRGLRALIPSFGVGIVAAFLIGFIVLLLLKGIGNPLIFGWRGMIFVLWSAILGGALFVRGHALVFSSLSFILICLISFLTYQDYEYITGINGIYSQNLTISSENIILGATITIPSNIKEKLPGVVLIPGSGPQDRDETFGLHNATFREIALFLSQNGFVVLRYDKRGAGSSSGVFTESGLYDFAKDAENAFLYLKSRPEVDSSKVFLLGHSYGGKVATIVASRHPETAGLILLACVASKEPDNILRQNQFIAYAKGMNTKERKKHFEDLKAWFNGVKNNKYQYYEDYFGPDGLAEKLQKTQKVNPIPPIW